MQSVAGGTAREGDEQDPYPHSPSTSWLHEIKVSAKQTLVNCHGELAPLSFQCDFNAGGSGQGRFLGTGSAASPPPARALPITFRHVLKKLGVGKDYSCLSTARGFWPRIRKVVRKPLMTVSISVAPIAMRRAMGWSCHGTSMMNLRNIKARRLAITAPTDPAMVPRTAYSTAKV